MHSKSRNSTNPPFPSTIWQPVYNVYMRCQFPLIFAWACAVHTVQAKLLIELLL